MTLLQPLTAARTPSSSNQTVIHCCTCNHAVAYADAFNYGWRYDPLGVPFTAYFCPPCARHFEKLQEE